MANRDKTFMDNAGLNEDLIESLFQNRQIPLSDQLKHTEITATARISDQEVDDVVTKIDLYEKSQNLDKGLKILIINSSGNVGKSLIARELFFSTHADINRYTEDDYINIIKHKNTNLSILRSKIGKQFFSKNLDLYEFDSLNEGSEPYLKESSLKKHYKKFNTLKSEHLLEGLVSSNNVVFDIGSSININFLNIIEDHQKLIDLFDIILIPVIPIGKVLADTNKLLKALYDNTSNKEYLVNRTMIIENNFADIKNIDFHLLLNDYKCIKIFKDYGTEIIKFGSHEMVQYLDKVMKCTFQINYKKDYLTSCASLESNRKKELEAIKDTNPSFKKSNIAEVNEKYNTDLSILKLFYLISSTSKNSKNLFLDILEKILIKIEHNKGI